MCDALGDSPRRSAGVRRTRDEPRPREDAVPRSGAGQGPGGARKSAKEIGQAVNQTSQEDQERGRDQSHQDLEGNTDEDDRLAQESAEPVPGDQTLHGLEAKEPEGLERHQPAGREAP